MHVTFLPVAQLDSASDSDSEGRRFESFRVGQKREPPQGVVLFFGSPAGAGEILFGLAQTKGKVACNLSAQVADLARKP